jgi:hypothetical protein
MSRKQIAFAAVVGPVGTGALIAKIAMAAGAGTGWAVGIAALVLAAGALAFLVHIVGLAEDLLWLVVLVAIPVGGAVASALWWTALPWWAWSLIFAAGVASLAFLVLSGLVAAAFARANRV